MLSHTFRIWERVVDKRLREVTSTADIQLDFIPVRQLVENYKGQKKMHMIYIDFLKS